MGKKIKIRRTIKPHVSYPGSLLQGNFGEEQHARGYLLWDLRTLTATKKIVPNEYGYITLHIKNGVLSKTQLKKIPTKPRIRFIIENTNYSQINDIIKTIKKNYDVQSIMVNRVDNAKDIKRYTQYNLAEDVKDIKFQNKLLKEFLKNNTDLENKEIRKIIKLNNDFNVEIQTTDNIGASNWKIKSLEFSNLFSYGENNYINFEKLSNVVGLFGKNASGKCVDESTKIDIKFDEEEIIKILGFLPKELKKTIITLKDIYNIFQKYGDLNINVNTPYGYKKILACDITAKNSKVLSIKTTKNNLHLKCSPNHKIKVKNGNFIAAKNLNLLQQIKTINGNESIISIELLKEKKDLYDIQVDEVEQYYSNGIVSHNSSLIDIILFTLFDKSSRAFKGEDIINVNKNDFYSILNFEMNGDDYYIKKTGKRLFKNNKSLRVAITIDFWRERDGIKETLNDVQRKQTRKKIRQIIGTFNDFKLTSVSLQNDNTGFIDMKQTERKEFLSQILKMDIFDTLYVKALDMLKEQSTVLKMYDEDDVEGQYETAINELTVKTEELKKVEALLIKKQATHKAIDSDLLKKNRSLKEINIDRHQNLETLNHDYKQYNQELYTIKNHIKLIDDEIKNITKEIEKIGLADEKTVNANFNLYNVAYNKKVQLKQELNNLKTTIQYKLDKMIKLKDLEYDPNCSYCMNNIFVKDAIQTKNTLIEDKKLLQNATAQFKKAKEKVITYEKYQKAFKQYLIDSKKLSTLKYKLEQTKIQKLQQEKKMDPIQDALKEIDKTIKLFKQNKKNIDWNKLIQNKIDILISKKNELYDEINRLNEKKSEYNADIKVAQTIKKNLSIRMNNMENIEQNLKLLKHYSNAVSRDGIPYTLINQIIPALEEETNNILSMLVDFSILFEMDGKHINLKIVKDNETFWPIELTSGFEKFISSLAIRIAITKVSNIPKPNFLIIDEGWGNFDADNISSVGPVFDYLKTQFDFIIIVSHLDSLKGSVDMSLDITSNKNFSQIIYK